MFVFVQSMKTLITMRDERKIHVQNPAKGSVKDILWAIGIHARVFLVPKKNPKLWPMFNMKPFKHSNVAKGFKMATLEIGSRSLCPGNFVVSLVLAFVSVFTFPFSKTKSFSEQILSVSCCALWPFFCTVTSRV